VGVWRLKFVQTEKDCDEDKVLSKMEEKMFPDRMARGIAIDLLTDDKPLSDLLKTAASEVANTYKDVSNTGVLADYIFRRFAGGIRAESKHDEDVLNQLGIDEEYAERILLQCAGRMDVVLRKQKHKEAGVTHYRWSTSGDGRVCERCRKLDGKKISWNKPPPGGHPGECGTCKEGYCRCVAVPELDPLL